MRHVDDSHHTEGDGKADRSKQQDRAERNAVPDILPDAPDRKASLDTFDGRLSGNLERTFGARLEFGEERNGLAGSLAGDALDRSKLVGFGTVGEERRGGECRIELRLERRICLRADCSLDCGNGIRVGIGNEGFDRGEADLRIR